jgi:riboflavin synthase
MFTGIIEATACVLERKGKLLSIERPRAFRDIKIGSSICVSGVCLTVTKLSQGQCSFDVVPTTLKKSTLGSLSKGDHVNLERALLADGRFDGHVVQGHCEGVGKVVKPGFELQIRVPKHLWPYIVQHGSITIDGVSLTVASWRKGVMTIALVPHTLQETTLGALRIGDEVNLETDILGRYISHLVNGRA